MENKNSEREIDLGSLLYYMLKHWTFMLITILAFMIMFGGYKYISILSSDKKGVEEIAYDVTNGLENASSLTGDYMLYYNMLSSKSNIENELYNLELSLEMLRSELELKRTNVTEFEQAQEGINSADLALFINYMNIARSEVADCENNIKDKENRIQSAQTAIKKLDGNMKTLSEKIGRENSHDNIISIIRYIVLGIIAGIVVFIGMCGIIYMFSGKLRDTNILRDTYGLPVLAVVPSKAKKGINAHIEKLNGYASRTREQAYDTVYSRILNLVVGDKNRILITGTISGEVIKIITYLNKKDSTIKYIFCPNPIENPDSILMFQNADVILLVECKNKSMIKEIEQELSFIKDMNKEPLGIVVVN